MGVETFAQWAVAGLGTLGGGKFLFDLLTVKSANKKTNAEGSVILVDSASSYAQTLVSRIDTLSKTVDEMREEQEKRNRTQDRLYRVHARWDLQVQHELHKLGIEVPEPPPLLSDADA